MCRASLSFATSLRRPRSSPAMQADFVKQLMSVALHSWTEPAATTPMHHVLTACASGGGAGLATALGLNRPSAADSTVPESLQVRIALTQAVLTLQSVVRRLMQTDNAELVSSHGVPFTLANEGCCWQTYFRLHPLRTPFKVAARAHVISFLLFR